MSLNREIKQAPFFIVGTPRSGTTLLRLLLDSHPRLAVPPESNYLLRIGPKLGPLYEGYQTRKGCLNFLWDARCIPEVSDWYPFKSRLQLEESVDTPHHYSYPWAIVQLFQAYAAIRGKERWGDKTPKNLWAVDDLLRLFPDAKVILLTRDCRAVANSLKHAAFAKQEVAHSAQRWLRESKEARRLIQAYPDQVKRFQFEQLVTQPMATLDSILRYISESPCPDLMDRYSKHSDDVGHVKSNYYRKMPNPEAIHSWKKKLSPNEILICESIAGNALLEEGYTLINEHSGEPLRLSRWKQLHNMIGHYLNSHTRAALYSLTKILICRAWNLPSYMLFGKKHYQD